MGGETGIRADIAADTPTYRADGLWVDPQRRQEPTITLGELHLPRRFVVRHHAWSPAISHRSGSIVLLVVDHVPSKNPGETA